MNRPGSVCTASVRTSRGHAGAPRPATPSSGAPSEPGGLGEDLPRTTFIKGISPHGSDSQQLRLPSARSRATFNPHNSLPSRVRILSTIWWERNWGAEKWGASQATRPRAPGRAHELLRLSLHNCPKPPLWPSDRSLCRVWHDSVVNEYALLDVKTKVIQTWWLGWATSDITIWATVTHSNFKKLSPITYLPFTEELFCRVAQIRSLLL